MRLEDKAGVFVFVFGGVFLLWYQACCVLPFYYKATPTIVYVHYIATAWLAFNIYFNMYKIFITDTTCHRRHHGNQPESKDWKDCRTCQLYSPPRSHHCKVCDKCILKRDHHCWFAGSCIGYHNHRYYVVMVIYIVIAGVYCNIFNYNFVKSSIGGFGVMKIIWFLAPHVGWLIGDLDNYGFCITLLSSVGFILTILFTWLLCIQLIQIKHGQTKYERKKGIFKYNMGHWRTLYEVLGDSLFFVLLSPFLPSPLQGEGYAFEDMEQKQN